MSANFKNMAFRFFRITCFAAYGGEVEREVALKRCA
jgi:hypothetical protein